MTRMKNWLIYRSDGRYVGQSVAFAAKVAFCQYMVLFGKQIRENEVEFETIDDNKQRIVYESQEFLVMTQ
jgi:hypothetical protein